MFTYAELMELENLCTEDRRFKKYVERFRDENNQLLSKIIHEIANPLTIIYSTIQLMESRNPSIKEQKYWEQLSRDIKDLTSLLKDYSDYSSCDSLSLQNENILELLQNVSKSFEPAFEEHNITYSSHFSPSMASAMTSYPCDKIKLRQVFTNIIKNGMEALGDNGDIWIKIPEKGSFVEDLEQGKDFLIIQLGNNGAPIPENELNHMFSPIVSGKEGGCGIGLTISNKIMQAHGGVIFVSSKEDATNFIICLPLQK